MFGINQRLASSDLTVNYPFEYNPNRRNSDGGGNVRGSQKKNSRKSMCSFFLCPIIGYSNIRIKKLGDIQYFLLLSDRLAAGSEPALNEDYAFHIKTHPALKEFPPHYPNGFKLLVSK